MEQGLANFCKPETIVKERGIAVFDETLFMDIDIWISYSFQVSQTIIFFFFSQPFFKNVKTILDAQKKTGVLGHSLPTLAPVHLHTVGAKQILLNK